MTIAHHYTSESILRLFNLERNGLVPYRRLEMLNPDEQGDKFIFAFMEKRPSSWIKNSKFPGVWTHLMKHMSHGDFSIYRCSFEVSPRDATFVVDWAHMERVRKEINKSNIFSAGKEDLERIKEANKRYIASKTPLSEYKGGFSLPELIIASPISGDRLKVEEYNPTN